MADRTADIRTALRTALLGTAGIPDLQGLEGWKFTPQMDQSYVTESLKPVTNRPMEIGPNPWTRMTGTYRIDAFVPSGGGNSTLDLLLDAIIASFPVGPPLTAGAEKVAIDFAQRGGASKDKGFLTAAITISWHSDKIGS